MPFVVLLSCCGIVWREREGDGVIIEAVLVVSLVSKRRKKRHTYDFFIHNSHKFLLFVIVFCRQVFFSFFIIHPCCRLVVNLVSKKHRKKTTYLQHFHFSFTVRMFLPFCRPSPVMFIYHPCCRLVVNLVSKIHIEKKKKNNLPIAFFIFHSQFTCSCPFVIIFCHPSCVLFLFHHLSSLL